MHKDLGRENSPTTHLFKIILSIILMRLRPFDRREHRGAERRAIQEAREERLPDETESTEQPANLTLHIEEAMSPEQKDAQRIMLRDIYKSVDYVTSKMQKQLLDSIQQDEFSKRLSPRILKFIVDHAHELLTPSFTVLSGHKAEEFQRELYEDAIKGREHDEDTTREARNLILHPLRTDDFIMLFQLPKLAARLWWKSNSRAEMHLRHRGLLAKNRNRTLSTIPWGRVYDLSMQVLTDIYKNHPEDSLAYERINFPYQHKEDAYYYVWRIWERQEY